MEYLPTFVLHRTAFCRDSFWTDLFYTALLCTDLFYADLFYTDLFYADLFDLDSVCTEPMLSIKFLQSPLKTLKKRFGGCFETF